MSKKLNLVTKILLALAILSFAFGIFTMSTNKTYATTTDEFYMEGAEIRLDENNGIRFVANLPASEYDASAKYYMIIIPSQYIDTYELTDECDYYEKLVTTGGLVPDSDNPTVMIMQTKPLQVDNSYKLKGTISNVLYGNSHREFFAVAYKETTSGDPAVTTRKYATTSVSDTRSLSYVASQALNDSKYSFNNDQKTILNNMIKKAYNAKAGNAETAMEDLPTISLSSTSVDLGFGKTQALTVNNLPDVGEQVAWSTEDTDKITVDEKGNVLGIGQGEATVNAKVLGQTYSATVTVGAPTAKPSNQLEIKDAQFNTAGNCDGGNVGTGSWWPAPILPAFEGYQNVLKFATTDNSGNSAINKDAVMRFNKTSEELTALVPTIETITIRFYSEEAYWMVTPSSTGKTLDANQWHDVVINMSDILTMFEGEAEQDKINAFVAAACNTGSGKTRLFTAEKNKTFYIACIYFGLTGPDMLETFNKVDSTKNAQYNTAGNCDGGNVGTGSWWPAEHQAEYKGATGVMKFATTDNSGNSAINKDAVMRFNKTLEELTALVPTIETITIRFYSEESYWMVTPSSTGKVLAANTWHDVVINMSDILTKFDGSTEQDKINAFVAAACNTGSGKTRLFTAEKNKVFYIDYVSFQTAE